MISSLISIVVGLNSMTTPWLNAKKKGWVSETKAGGPKSPATPTTPAHPEDANRCAPRRSSEEGQLASSLRRSRAGLVIVASLVKTEGVKMNSVCVFAGSSFGGRREYEIAAAVLGKAIAGRDLTLLYGVRQSA